MRRWMAGLMAFLMLIGCGTARTEGEDSFVVVEDEEQASPDVRHQARALMRLMTDEEKVYQLFFVTPEDLTGESRVSALPEENVLARYPVGGVMLFGQNIVSAEQLSALTDAIQAQARAAKIHPVIIGVNEEGGAVSRVANKLGYDLAQSPGEIGESGDEGMARAAGLYIAGYIAPLGIHIAFAPPADTQADTGTVGVQAYGSDPALVSRMAAAMAEGLREGGVIPCYTHFPGHGEMEGNRLSALSIRRALEDMRNAEFLPFAGGIAGDIEMILVSHGVVRAVGDDMPASLSRRVITGILREELGYGGVVITDSLRMKAVTVSFKSAQAAVQALQAGADMLLLPADFEAAVRGVFKALETGELTMERIEESVERILALKIRAGLIQ